MSESTTPQPSVSDEYIITTEMLMARTKRSERSIRTYVETGLLPPGKHRTGVRLLFWTQAQANRLMKRIGCKAKPFGPHDRYDLEKLSEPPLVASAGTPDRLVAGCVSHMLQMMIAGSNPETVAAAQRLLNEISGPLESRLHGKGDGQ